MYTIQGLSIGTAHGGYFMDSVPYTGPDKVIDGCLIPGSIDSDTILNCQPVLVIGAGLMGKLIAGWLAIRGATVQFNKETALKSIYGDIKTRETRGELKENTAELLKSENNISIYLVLP